jgi:ribose transport system substrate-binding protein
LALLSLTGCSGGSPESGAAPASGSAGGDGDGKPFLMFISNSNSDWWSAVEKGMQDGGKEFGARVVLKRNDGRREGQIRYLEDALSLPDVKGVAVSVLDAKSPGIADRMRDLQKAGKAVITIDSDGQADARRAYIGTNNRKAGAVAGKVAAALRPKGGKTAFFVGEAASTNALERLEGFLEGAGTSFVKVETFEDHSDKNRAQVNVSTAITKYPDLDVLVGLWSYNAPAIGEEVSRSAEVRKRVTVVTFDLDERAVNHLEQRRIDASVVQNPYEMGYQGVKLLKAMITNDTATIGQMLPNGATEIDTGVRVITPSKEAFGKEPPVPAGEVFDIQEMKSWLAGKGLKSS